MKRALLRENRERSAAAWQNENSEPEVIRPYIHPGVGRLAVYPKIFTGICPERAEKSPALRWKDRGQAGRRDASKPDGESGAGQPLEPPPRTPGPRGTEANAADSAGSRWTGGGTASAAVEPLGLSAAGNSATGHPKPLGHTFRGGRWEPSTRLNSPKPRRLLGPQCSRAGRRWQDAPPPP